jgi:hypothetical protein
LGFLQLILNWPPPSKYLFSIAKYNSGISFLFFFHLLNSSRIKKGMYQRNF